MDEIEIYKRALEREKKARRLAEKIIEDKSSELYASNQELKRINKFIEEEVKSRTAEIQDLFDHMYDGYATISTTGDILKTNIAARVILGYDPSEEIDNLSLKDIVHEDDKVKLREYIDKLHTEGYYSNYVGRIYDKSGVVKWLEVNSNAIYDDQGKIVGSRDILRDVTDKVVAETNLRETEERLKAVFNNNSIGVSIYNKRGGFVSLNQTFAQQLGYPEEYYKGKSAARFMHKEDVQKYKSTMLDIYNRTIEKISVESRYIRKDGSIFWANSNISGVYHDEKLIYFIVMAEDITEKKIAQQQLIIQEEKYRNIIANMNLGLLEVDLNDVVQYANQGFVNMSQYQLEELVGQKASDLFVATDDHSVLKKKSAQRAEGISDAYELRVKRKNGEYRWWLISGAPRYNDLGSLVGSIGIHLDITDQKDMQDKLQASLRSLEYANNELQDFAHVVSHDLKSPLRSISGLIQILQEDYNDKLEEEGVQIIEDVIARTEHMDELIGGILSYSSIQDAEDKKTSFNSKEVIDKLFNYIELPDHFSISFQGDFPVLTMNPIHFQQLMQNLLTNAIKYNDKERGQVKIAITSNKNYHVFSVQDNGLGINDRNRDKIFNMFQKFDTKGKSSSGIGLAIVKKIVELYRGKVSLKSKVGEGSTFYFYLPK